MERRTLLAALGTIGAGGAVVTGTGAFTSVEAERDLTVDIADDANALLALEPNGPNGDYVDTSNGTVGIDITGSNGDVDGSGVNTDAITRIDDLFKIRNQGTQAVEVSVTPVAVLDPGLLGYLWVFVVPTSNFPTVSLGVGEEETYSLITVSVSADISNLGVDTTLTVEAQA